MSNMSPIPLPMHVIFEIQHFLLFKNGEMVETCSWKTSSPVFTYIRLAMMTQYFSLHPLEFRIYAPRAMWSLHWSWASHQTAPISKKTHHTRSAPQKSIRLGLTHHILSWLVLACVGLCIFFWLGSYSILSPAKQKIQKILHSTAWFIWFVPTTNNMKTLSLVVVAALWSSSSTSAFQFMSKWKMPVHDPHEQAVKERFGDKSTYILYSQTCACHVMDGSSTRQVLG